MAITAKELFLMEANLLYSMDPAFADGNADGSEEDKMIFEAFSAVQALRQYLENKEREG